MLHINQTNILCWYFHFCSSSFCIRQCIKSVKRNSLLVISGSVKAKMNKKEVFPVLLCWMLDHQTKDVSNLFSLFFNVFFVFFAGAIYMNIPFLVAVILLPSWDDATRMASKPFENKLKVGCLTLRKHYFYKYVSHKKVLRGVFIALRTRILCPDFEPHLDVENNHHYIS